MVRAQEVGNGSKQTLSLADRSVIADMVAAYDLDLRHFITSRISQMDELEDVIQEVYLRLSRYEDIKGIRSPKSFLFRIAQTVMIDRNRKAVVRQVSAHSPLDDTQLTDNTPLQEQQVAGKQELDVFCAALKAMPPKPRQAFILSRMDGLTYKEIARHMAVSVKSVEKYMSDALDYMARHIGNPLHDTSFKGGDQK